MSGRPCGEPATTCPSRLWRHSEWDVVLVALAFMHGAILVLWPSIPLIALGLWWNSNTVAHNFLHLPFFRGRALNRCFSVYLSLLLGMPQSLWRARHLAHHANTPVRLRPSKLLLTETVTVIALWIVLVSMAPEFSLFTYLPGYLLGLGLCQVHGFYEHQRDTVSHYDRVYNFLFSMTDTMSSTTPRPNSIGEVFPKRGQPADPSADGPPA